METRRAGEILVELVGTLRIFRSGNQHGRDGQAISGTKIGMLRALSHGSARLGDLARQLSVSMSVASRAVDALAAEGLVQRRADEADRRALTISITDRGRLDIDRRHRSFAERFARVLDDWSEEDAQQALRTLRELNERLEQLNDLTNAEEGSAHAS